MNDTPHKKTPDDSIEAAFQDDEQTITGEDPFLLFHEWLTLAGTKEPNDPNAMALATVDEHGLPDARMVLLKGVDETGFIFYTNSESAKGRELEGNMQAALLFHWKSLRRQVRIRGRVSRLPAVDADAYFDSRPRASRIGAWASQQSRPIASRTALWKAVTKETARFAIGPIPRPPYWNGYHVTPASMEFWMDKPFRLHDRVLFTRTQDGQHWTTQRLFP
ncbi:pyridoxamine 5'-phosphate oxidase [Parasaccharibacter sp. TMW2.1890]|uniref:pyridoxamine 5'-phosphate oxidase n=1 Tax=Parasaccharibacter sp. TMW2.1890 TaxID=2039289 RepID=UPI0020127848|nr:pyridoxamine 5'-phosphate oxidase [Parasaccharibacter sp. TMW2.1890]MCL1514456.1 pyridoxamine 5'-phosphate oxidase [Parasaccharibacter sp. TMW2.1890]